MDSKAEETHLFNMIQLDTSIPRRQWIHVGGMKLGDDWIWRSDYTKIYSGMKWGPGEPNYWKNSEFCLALEKNQGTGIAGYIDGSCTEHKSPFMCESHMSTEIKPTSILISNDPAINEVLNVLMATIGSSQTSIHKFKTTKIVIANHEYDDTLVKETTENNI